METYECLQNIAITSTTTSATIATTVVVTTSDWYVGGGGAPVPPEETSGVLNGSVELPVPVNETVTERVRSWVISFIKVRSWSVLHSTYYYRVTDNV